MTTTTKVVVPTLKELVSDSDGKLNGLAVLLNQPPPEAWVKKHPIISSHKYLPRERVEYLLTRVYTTWRIEVLTVQLIANSVVTTVRLHVRNPVTTEWEWQDGVGACPLQTDKGAGSVDFNAVKSGSVQMAAPASKTYAFKDAAENLGKLFGKDLNVQDIDYNGLLPKGESKKPKLASKGKENQKQWLDACEALRAKLVTLSQLEKKYEISTEDLLKLKSV